MFASNKSRLQILSVNMSKAVKRSIWFSSAVSHSISAEYAKGPFKNPPCVHIVLCFLICAMHVFLRQISKIILALGALVTVTLILFLQDTKSVPDVTPRSCKASQGKHKSKAGS